MKYVVVECQSCKKRFICYADDFDTIKKEGCSCGGEYVLVPEREHTPGNKLAMVTSELENINNSIMANTLPQILATVPKVYHESILDIIIQAYQLEV